jgi:hypothetical protein
MDPMHGMALGQIVHVRKTVLGRTVVNPAIVTYFSDSYGTPITVTLFSIDETISNVEVFWASSDHVEGWFWPPRN